MKKGAIISTNNKYRYKLWRVWDKTKPRVLFIMLNPSKANADTDDPTIRRCIGFAKSWSFGGIMVGNLFAYRSTDPKKLARTKDPFGKENAGHVAKMAKKCKITVAAWGNNGILEKINNPYQSLDLIKKLYYIKLSKDGTPRHPLYLKATLKPKKWEKTI